MVHDNALWVYKRDPYTAGGEIQCESATQHPLTQRARTQSCHIVHLWKQFSA
jgi:hypothetical protein